MSLSQHHDHKHSHEGHAAHAHAPHGHSHENAPARRANPGVSLLRMSSMQRLALASALVAAIWLSVFWAWS